MSQAMPWAWSAVTTWGKLFGLALLASWQRAQMTAVSSFGGLTVRGIVSVLGLRAVAGLARDHHMPALLFLVNDLGVAGLADLWPAKAMGRAAISAMASPR